MINQTRLILLLYRNFGTEIIIALCPVDKIAVSKLFDSGLVEENPQCPSKERRHSNYGCCLSGCGMRLHGKDKKDIKY